MKCPEPVAAVVACLVVACGSSGGSAGSSADATTDHRDAATGHRDAATGHRDAATDHEATAKDSGHKVADAGNKSALSIFVVPSTVTDLSDTSFFDHPWPSDYRLDANGNIILTGFVNPYDETIISTYITALTGQIKGFSTVAFGYLRFATDIDSNTLPSSPTELLSASSTVQLINVDPSSPEHDQRHLAQIYYRESAGDYWQPDTLVVGPALGYPLLASTKYAIVVTRGVKAADGTPFAPSADLSAVLGLTPTSATNKPVHDLFAPALADLASLGIKASDIAQFTTFTTNDPTAVLFSMADAVPSQIPAPTVLTNGAPGVSAAEAGDDGGATASSLYSDTADVEPGIYDVYRGWYGPAPNYQDGVPPYSSSGGDFVFDAGTAVIQDTFPMLFTLVVPNATKCPMPANGYPILIYAHGTGGSNRSVIDEGNSVGDAMARQCVASIGTDQIFQGVRPGAPAPDDPNAETEENLDVFNVANPACMRAVTIQSAIDVVQEARLFTETKLTVPAGTSVTGKTIAFDASKILFMGHSQGSLNGPLYLAADRSARGGVLSGASSDVSITLLDKTSPAPSVAALWLVGLGIDNQTDAADAEMNIFHPAMSFAQTAMDRIDPLVYMKYLVQSPRPGHAPKSIYQTEGVNPDGTGDTYAPPPASRSARWRSGCRRSLPSSTPSQRTPGVGSSR